MGSKLINQEIIILEALIQKIKNEPNKAFFCKNYFKTRLLTWDEIEKIINDYNRCNEKQIELIDKNNKKIDYPLVQGTWVQDPKPDSKYIINHVNNGCSLVLIGCSRFNQCINNICFLIESIIPNTAVDVHTYCGLKGSKSFKAHFDYADNIIFHQNGKCHWKIYKQRAEDCNYERNLDGKTLDIEFEVDIEPNDMIYVPNQQYHECIPLEKRISLSFPIVQGQSIDRNWYKIK